jgi:hypothetical protein
MVAAAALPLLRKDAWWVRIFDFPRLQIAFLLAATLAAFMVFKWDPGPAENLGEVISTVPTVPAVTRRAGKRLAGIVSAFILADLN